MLESPFAADGPMAGQGRASGLTIGGSLKVAAKEGGLAPSAGPGAVGGDARVSAPVWGLDRPADPGQAVRGYPGYLYLGIRPAQMAGERHSSCGAGRPRADSTDGPGPTARWSRNASKNRVGAHRRSRPTTAGKVTTHDC